MKQTFGSYLKEVRKLQGLTVNQLSIRSGISAAQISRIENGKRSTPQPKSIESLSRSLNVDYEKMMFEAGYIKDKLTPEIDFGDYLKSIRKSRKMTIRQLENRSGVSNAYLSQVENGKRQIPSPDILKKLADGLDYPYKFLMSKAGYIEEDENLTIDNLVIDDHPVSNKEKEMILALIRSYRSF